MALLKKERTVKIKTRDALRGTVRTLDRTVKVTGRGAGEAQRQAGEAAQSDNRSENEYAGNQVQNTGRTAARAVIYGADRFGRWGMRQTGKNIRNFRNRKMKVKSVKVKRLTARTRKALQTSRNAVKGTVKATKATAKGTRRAIQAVKAAVKATVKFAKVAAKAIVAAVKGIVAAIAAGGWVAVVVVLLICAVGLVFGGVYSYVSKEEEDSERSLYQLVSVAESEYYDEIERLKSEYVYDLCDTTGTCIDRQLAVVAYLVERNLIGQDIVFDDARSEDFKQFYRLLHTSTLYSETVLQAETVWEEQDDGTLVPVERKTEKTKLYVNITSLNAEEIADYFDFDDGEKKCFEGLLEVDFDMKEAQNVSGLLYIKKSKINNVGLCIYH